MGEFWQRATGCDNSGGSCVEVAYLGEHGVRVRDRRGVVVEYDRTEWETFVAGVKAGEFDR